MKNLTTQNKRITCDCGCPPKDHHKGVGQCSKSGCTWYHPNTRYILDKKANDFLVCAQNISGRKKKRDERPIEFRRNKIRELYNLCQEFLAKNKETIK